MTPEEREAEHVRQIRLVIEQTQSGSLNPAKASPPGARPNESGGQAAEETVVD
jgi:hypothetical protein